jgi:16S rRNA (uracil1498-N3)-methyltransferase
MRIPRVYLDQALQPGRSLTLPPEQDHYVSRVLRLAPGSPLVLFNGDGSDYAAEVLGHPRAGMDVRVDARLPAVPPSQLNLTLVQGLSRGERMDYSLQKATELGVAAFQPVCTARTELRLGPEKLPRRMAHWRSVIVSACEQCGRAELPDLRAPLELHAWLEQESASLRLVLVPGAEQSLAAVGVQRDVELLVGPEGGFENAELDLLQRRDVRPVHLGPRILRTETAGPAAIAVLQAMAGDLA